MMLSNEIVKAIDTVLAFANVKKLCYGAEDEEAYYFTPCCDNGEESTGTTMCRVTKDNYKCSYVYHYDKYFDTPKTKIEFPEERQSVYCKMPWDF